MLFVGGAGSRLPATIAVLQLRCLQYLLGLVSHSLVQAWTPLFLPFFLVLDLRLSKSLLVCLILCVVSSASVGGPL